MSSINLNEVTYIVIDGYVHLDNEGKKGLGVMVFDHFESKILVIGVAKSSFLTNQELVTPVYRGKSKKALYVTAVGIELKKAVSFIQKMDGPFRMPTLLQQLDTKTKEA